MFKKFPFTGWALVAALLWTINFFHFHAHRSEMLPAEMAKTINKATQDANKEYQEFITDKKLITRIVNDSLSETDIKKIKQLPFYTYAYNSGSLFFWSNNSVIAAENDSISGEIAVRRNAKGTFIRQYFYPDPTNKSVKLVTLIPVYISYPIENQYLKSHFVASELIPTGTKISNDTRLSGEHFPLTIDGKTQVADIVFNTSEIQLWEPDWWMIITVILAALATGTWLQKMLSYLIRKRSDWEKLTAVTLTIGGVAVLQRKLGLPFHLEELHIFSPQLFSSDSILSTLGDLFIVMGYMLWWLVYIIRFVGYKTPLKIKLSPLFSWIFGGLYIIAIPIVSALFTYVVSSIIIDSKISFHVTHFYEINAYTIVGLLAIIGITAIWCLAVYLANCRINLYISHKWVKYLLFAVIAYTFYYFEPVTSEDFLWGMSLSVLVFMMLCDIPGYSLTSRVFAPHMLVWALIVCSFGTGLVWYYNDLKEKGNRQAFAEQKLAEKRDNLLEYNFEATAKKLQFDKAVLAFVKNPAPGTRKSLEQHLETSYMTGPLSRYKLKLYIYDKAENPLFNIDTSSYQTHTREKEESDFTESPFLSYRVSINDRHYYIHTFNVYYDSVNTVAGHVVMNLEQKKDAQGAVYPELLQPVSDFTNIDAHEYAYAVYVNNKLLRQTNDYPFPVWLKKVNLKENQPIYIDENGVNTMYLQSANKNRVYVIVHYHDTAIEAMTLFSYIFGLQVVIALLIYLYKLLLLHDIRRFFSRKFYKMTLRRKVHVALLVIVFISFLLVGYATITFFVTEYRSTNESKFKASLENAKSAVTEYLSSRSAFGSISNFDTVSRSAEFRTVLAQFATNQHIDINFYDNDGNLLASSQDEIYDKGLISRKMRPDAFFELNNLGKSLVIQRERAGTLNYQSAYQPIRDEGGATLAFINVPFFSSEKDLDFQVSSIVITLINLYAFIFLASSLFTVIVTRGLTRSFDLIIKQFDKLNLDKNERIEWSSDDEIGRLVAEYNKMVMKVEENARRLAQNEREMAWREMARQVAHEIKNPLTPMKLNIQYLRQAMKNNQPNVKELTERVSESIIEQIDNLSYIASEFSNFAKMPEAKPDLLNVAELLRTAAELYLNTEDLKVSFQMNTNKIMVISDKSQLLRVFTNILENAKQAIPEERNGEITIATSFEEGFVTIAFTDNGSGIDDEAAQRIFQPYFTTKSSGTGLGLAMTRKIIEFWKGEIWFETQQNEGTTFYIKLPLSNS